MGILEQGYDKIRLAWKIIGEMRLTNAYRLRDEGLGERFDPLRLDDVESGVQNALSQTAVSLHNDRLQVNLPALGLLPRFTLTDKCKEYQGRLRFVKERVSQPTHHGPKDGSRAELKQGLVVSSGAVAMLTVSD